MAEVLVESHNKVLEDGDAGLLPELKVGEGEELVDLNSDATKPDLDSGVTAPAAKTKAAPAAGDGDDLPPELKGKSPKELAKMYKEAQSLIGRQGSELGELRRRTDTAIQASLAALNQRNQPAAAAASKEEDKPLDEADYFRAPGETIAKAIANHPVIKRIEETLGKSAQEQAISRATSATERFNATHPDAQEILADPEFRQWVTASRVRQQLLQRAHTNFDFEAGDEVFSTWKALKGVGKKAAAAGGAAEAAAASEAARVLSAQAKRKRDLAAAAVPSGGGGGGAPEGGSKKIFRRVDVLKLMETDNERYLALAPEIEKAYAEGRVR